MNQWVRANPKKLPTDWFRDPLYAEEVYRRMRTMLGEGYSHRDIAIAIGTSDRCVTRYAAKLNGWLPPSQRPGYTPKPRRGTPRKLNVEAVLEIRAADRTQPGWKKPLMVKYNIDASTVLGVASGQQWKHIPLDICPEGNTDDDRAA